MLKRDLNEIIADKIVFQESLSLFQAQVEVLTDLRNGKIWLPTLNQENKDLIGNQT